MKNPNNEKSNFDMKSTKFQTGLFVNDERNQSNTGPKYVWFKKFQKGPNMLAIIGNLFLRDSFKA